MGVVWSSCQLLTKAPTSSGKPSTSNPIQGLSLCGCLTEVCGKCSSCTLRSGPTSQRLRNQGALTISYFGKFSGCFWTWFKRHTPCRRTKRSSSQIKTQVTKSPFSPFQTCFSGAILVHCSAGVGRTGTFLAVYKLWLDYINPNIKELAVFPTVLELRKQRCKMVQKKEQYAYIANGPP